MTATTVPSAARAWQSAQLVADRSRAAVGGGAGRPQGAPPWLLPSIIIAATGAAVLVGAAAGIPTLGLVVIAAAPAGVALGRRWALTLLPLALLARTLVDDSGSVLLTGGIAVGLVGLAVLVLIRSSGWVLPVLFLTLSFAASAWAGAATHGAAVTFAEALRLVSAVAVVVVVSKAPGRLTPHGLARTVQAVGALPAALAVLQFLTGTGTYIDGTLRAQGTLAQANSAAVLFALCSLATFALLMDGSRHRVLDGGLMLLFVAAQVATGSIGGFVTFLVMLLVHLVTVVGRRIDRVMLGAATVGLAVYAAVNSRVGAQRLSEFGGGATGNASFQWRLQAWEKVLDAWRVHPWLGNGVGSTQSDLILVGSIPHNEYVRLLAEVGVVGTALVILVALRYAFVMFGRLRAGLGRPAASLALATLAGLAVNGLAANTMLYSASFYLALFVLSGAARVTAPSPAPVAVDALGLPVWTARR